MRVTLGLIVLQSAICWIFQDLAATHRTIPIKKVRYGEITMSSAASKCSESLRRHEHSVSPRQTNLVPLQLSQWTNWRSWRHRSDWDWQDEFHPEIFHSSHSPKDLENHYVKNATDSFRTFDEEASELAKLAHKSRARDIFGL